jgi:indole-3-glycerol phosphate synthase
MSTDFLAAMAASSHERVTQARAQVPQSELRARAASAAPVPRLRLSGQFDLIAEVKLRSPAAGQLKQTDEDIGARVTEYAQAGAAAISVLTEPSRFDGSMTHLQHAGEALNGLIPVMRKDFLVDAYQVWEARVAGAGGVLIILRMLERARLRSLIEAAAQLGLFALLEAFDQQDLQLASELVREYQSSSSLLVGINCRDLVSLKVVPGRLEALAPLLPAGVPRVAESGVATAADAERLVRSGFDLALVGSALMQAKDPLELARSMLRVGRAAATRPCG